MTSFMYQWFSITADLLKTFLTCGLRITWVYVSEVNRVFVWFLSVLWSQTSAFLTVSICPMRNKVILWFCYKYVSVHRKQNFIQGQVTQVHQVGMLTFIPCRTFYRYQKYMYVAEETVCSFSMVALDDLAWFWPRFQEKQDLFSDAVDILTGWLVSHFRSDLTKVYHPLLP